MEQFSYNFLFKKVHGSQIASSQSSDVPYITFIFDETVTVTESFYKSLSYSELFSTLGGSLGLWLGVGIMQIIEHAADCGKIMYSISQKFKK